MHLKLSDFNDLGAILKPLKSAFWCHQDQQNPINLIAFDEYIILCKNKNIKEASNFLINILNNGFSVIDILESICIYLKYHTAILNEEQIYKIIILKLDGE